MESWQIRKVIISFQQNDSERALNYLRQVKDQGLEHEEMEFLAGKCLQTMKRHSEAISEFDTAIAKYPKDCNLYFMRSTSKSSLGDKEGELEVKQLSTRQETAIPKSKKLKQGQGFSAIAGMQELKDTIKIDIIDALNEKGKYAEYGLTIPNGMLLYGPPGCGKTFFAEKLAEEVGFSFYKIKPSDIQSKWVNASQENIRNLFEEARNNAPGIIFIDEVDALVPNRNDLNVSHMNTSVVNEFLAQMNNSGDEGLFVIGASNRPDALDPAILRSGRLDKCIYVPPPDFEARKSLFKLYLEKRPVEIGLDYDFLATSTENYVASDIKFLCDEASREALKSKSRVSMDILTETIRQSHPSISIPDLKRYDEVRRKMEGEQSNYNERTRIGFKK